MDEKEGSEYQPGRMKLTEITPYLEKAKAANQGDEPGALVDAIISAMRDSGADEASLNLQRKLLEAKFGIGSWQDVIAIQEEALRKQEAQNDVPGQISTLINLIGMAINGGDKQKAKQYVTEAERVLAQAKPEDIDLPLLGPTTISAETQMQLWRAEVERLRNWVS